MPGASFEVGLFSRAIGHGRQTFQLGNLLIRLFLEGGLRLAITLNSFKRILTDPDHLGSPRHGILSIATLGRIIDLGVGNTVDLAAINPQRQLRIALDTERMTGWVGQRPNARLVIQEEALWLTTHH